MDKTRRKLIRARVALISNHVFFGHLALELLLKEDNDLPIPTMGTDGVYIYYNKKFVDKLSDEEVKTAIAHEALHPALKHHLRIGNRNLRLWNVACDFALNQILEESNFTFPQGVLTTEARFKGMSAESIYNKISSSKERDNYLNESLVLMGDVMKPGQGKGDPGDSDQSGKGAVIGGKSPSDIARDQEKKWDIAISKAVHQAKLAGNCPGGMDEYLDELLAPQLDKKQILRRFIENNAKNDYSWSYPNRRHIWNDLYLPSLKSDSLGDMVFLMDLSGSMSSKEVQVCLSEIADILAEFTYNNIWVVHFDTIVQQVDHFEGTTFAPEFNPKGRGGTDIIPAINWIEERGIRPSCVIAFTDMGLFTMPEDPGYPFLWISTTKDKGPFGETIHLDVEDY